MQRERRKKGGFTIVELMVVVSLILLLSSLVLVGVGEAQRRAQTVMCMNNLSQVGQAIISYANVTGGGFLPNFGQDPTSPRVADQWVWELDFLTESDRITGRQIGVNSSFSDAVLPPRQAPAVLRCPADIHLFVNGQAMLTSYWMHPHNSYRYYPSIGQVPVRETAGRKVVKRSETILGFEGDAVNESKNCGCRFHTFIRPDEVDQNHSGGGHFLFADGTVRLITDPVQRTRAYWEAKF